ncbi:hypothetical protein SAMN04490198_4274 [Pseudomonas palleroniana]|uniref:Uncharacterized protein n=1 Tax=Pseudomonas palleroniana TaxID=191390 RepID=A0A1H5NGL8_9PSED|nr:hypothetical protein SAMN04490198_4274 [Pseudomonas palleroniana]
MYDKMLLLRQRMSNGIISLLANVGGGLLPIAVCQSQTSWLIYRYREQAPSHNQASPHYFLCE